MEHYNFKSIEKKWQEYWEKNKSFYFNPDDKRQKFYMLEMFPYPSGQLHTGHLRNFVIGDVIARFKRMQGYNVLHPMGADAFGLPAENAAIKRGIKPQDWTKQNIKTFIDGMKILGLSYDFTRFIVTCFPEYYGKQQEIFIDMLNNGLIYQKESFVNWDPIDQTVLANEQVIDGKGWRSGAVIEKKKLNQWFFKITKYSEELLQGIEKLTGWPEKVKLMQKNWIGKSEGAIVKFKLKKQPNDDLEFSIDFSEIEVYTTRPDTLFGASFVGISSNHPLAEELVKNDEKIAKFCEECRKTSIDEETIATMEKKGFDTGIKAINPFSGEELPVFIANFILMDYGTGAIFGCPAHDERDYDFAKKYGLKIRKVVEKEGESILPFVEDGIAINSNFLNGFKTKEAKEKAIQKIEEMKIGKRKVNYRLRDWGFSRQRYWGCPIPVVYCNDCGVVPVDKKDLPIKLPEDVVFDGKGNPLEKHPTWKYTVCPHCGKPAIRETDTMDTFVDSSWYFMRYPNLSENKAIDSELCNKILPINQYIGGIEHATMHLIYFRFFTKALRDCGYFNVDEPCVRLFNQGMVCHKAYRGKTTKDWCYPWNAEEKGGKFYNIETSEELSYEGVIKMSKSKSNVVDNNKIVDAYGADSARMFVLSDTPADKDFEWTTAGIDGCWKYINRFYRLVSNFKEYYNYENINYVNDIIKITHKYIKETTLALNNLEFNKAIAKIREFSNYLEKINPETEENKKSYYFALINITKLFMPFAPHLCSELLEKLNTNDMNWPVYNEELTIENTVGIAIQINGKLRGTIQTTKDLSKEELENLAKNEESIKKYLNNNDIKKVIVVPNKLVNFVI